MEFPQTMISLGFEGNLIGIQLRLTWAVGLGGKGLLLLHVLKKGGQVTRGDK